MRILIVDDEALARAFVAEQLAAIPGVEIVGEAANGVEAVKLAESLSPDLLLLDVQMPKLSGFEVLELLGERAPAVVFITAHDDPAFRTEAVERGCVGFFRKSDPGSLIVAALRRATATNEQPDGGPRGTW